MGRAIGLMPDAGYNVVIGAAIVSITLNPIMFRSIRSLEPRLAHLPWLMSRTEKLGLRANAAAAKRNEEPSGAIVVGYGPVGQTVTRLLSEFGIEPMIIETNVDAVLELQQRGQQALFGDARRPEILRSAGIESAAFLIVTMPQAHISLPIIQAAREVAPLIRVMSRASYINQSDQFMQAGAAVIRYDEAESAAALAEALLQEIDVPADQIDALVSSIRREFMPRRSAAV